MDATEALEYLTEDLAYRRKRQMRLADEAGRSGRYADAAQYQAKAQGLQMALNEIGKQIAYHTQKRKIS